MNEGALPPIIQNATISGDIEFTPHNLLHVEIEATDSTQPFTLAARNEGEFQAELTQEFGQSEIGASIQTELHDGDLYFTNSFNDDATQASGTFEVRQADLATAPIASNPHSLHFDGDASVGVESITEINNGQSTTVEAWVKLEESVAGEHYTIIANGSTNQGSSLSRGFELQASDSWYLMIGRSGDSFEILSGPEVVLNKWTHIAARITWGVGDVIPRATLFVDGEKVADVRPQDVNFFRPDGQSFVMGGGSITSAANWQGAIDEVRVWDGIRSDAEIRENYLKSVSPNEEDLVAYWKIDDGPQTGTQIRVKDSVGGDNSIYNGEALETTWNTRAFRVVASSEVKVTSGVVYGTEQASSRTFVLANEQVQAVQQVQQLGDLNGDGFGEVATQIDQGYEIYFGSATGIDFTAAADLNLLSSTLDSITAGDFNGDGQADLVVSDSALERVSVFFSIEEQSGTLELSMADAIHHISELDARSQIGHVNLDLDGDGRDDQMISTTAIDPINDSLETQTVFLLAGGNHGDLPNSFLVLENGSVPGSGSFVADRGTGRPEVFGNGDTGYQVEGTLWFQFRLIGDGGPGNWLRLLTEHSSVKSQLFDRHGAPISRSAEAIDLRNIRAGTYYLLVSSETPASFEIEFSPPRRGAVNSADSKRDRDTLRGGSGGDTIVADSDLDRVYGGPDSDGLYASSPEIRDLQPALGERALEDFTSEHPNVSDGRDLIQNPKLLRAIAAELGVAVTEGAAGPIVAREITESELSTITRLDISGSETLDWSELEWLTNLRELIASEAAWNPDLEVLEKLPRLEVLDLTGSSIGLGRLSLDWSKRPPLRVLKLPSSVPGVTFPASGNLAIESGQTLSFDLNGNAFEVVDPDGNVLDSCISCNEYEFSISEAGVYFLEQRGANGQPNIPVAPIIVFNTAPVISGLAASFTKAEGDSINAAEILDGTSVTDAGAVHTQVALISADGTYVDLTLGSLDLQDDVIEVPNRVLDGATDVTFSTWYRTTKTKTAFISALNAENDNEFLLFINDPDTLRVSTGRTSQTSVVFSGITELTDGQWHHLTVVRNASEGVIELYLDGQLRGRESASLDALRVDEGRLRIGQEQDSGGTVSPSQAFDGELDEIAIWQRALSQSQIQEFVASGVPANDADLVAYYPLNGNDGTLARDRSSAGNDGLIYSLDQSRIRFTKQSPVSRSYQFANDGLYTIEVSAVDAGGLVTKAQSQLEVVNLAPIARIGTATTEISVDELIVLSALNSLDRGALDNENLRFEWSHIHQNGQESILGHQAQLQFTASEVGAHTIRLKVTDPQGAEHVQEVVLEAAAAVQFRIEGATEDPTTSLVRRFRTEHGQQVVLDARESTAKPVGSARTYLWILRTRDGQAGPTDPLTIETEGPTFAFRADDVGLFDVTLTITDRIEGEEYVSQSNLQHTFWVKNVAPMIELGDNREVAEGAILEITPAITDPGANQTHTISWTIPSGVRLLNDSAPYQFVFPNDGAWILRARVIDSFGFSSNTDGTTERITVNVSNVAPDVTVIDDVDPADEGTLISFNGRFMVPCNRAGDHDGTFDDSGTPIYQVTWDFGDGTVIKDSVLAREVVGDTDTYLSSVEHRYADNGLYTVRLTVTDSRGAESAAERQVVVNNRAPELLNFVGPSSVDEDAFVQFHGTFSDVDGVLASSSQDSETVTATIDFGDGQDETLNLLSTTEDGVRSYTFSASHTYRRGGEYRVLLRVADDDGGILETTQTITVLEKNDPPQARVDRVSIVEGSSEITIDVLANDSFAPDADEQLTLESVANGVHGGQTQVDADGGSIVYVPAAGFVGTDRFTYVLTDDKGATATGDVLVTIVPQDPTRLHFDMDQEAVSSLQLHFVGSLIELRDAVDGRLLRSQNSGPLQRLEIFGRSAEASTVELVFDSPDALAIANGVAIELGSSQRDAVVIRGMTPGRFELGEVNSDRRNASLSNGQHTLELRLLGCEEIRTTYPLVELSGDALNINASRLQLDEQLHLSSFESVTLGGQNLPGVLEVPAGIQVDTGASIAGYGVIEGPIINRGTINGPTEPGQWLELRGPVSGDGAFTGNVRIESRFSPGNSPATVSLDGSLELGAESELVLEILELNGERRFDQLLVSGTFQASGRLVIDNELSVGETDSPNSLRFLDRVPLVSAGSIEGAFGEISGIDQTYAGGTLKLEVFQSEDLLELVVMPTNWTNFNESADVNGDGFVSPIDALLVINALNDSIELQGTPQAAASGGFTFYDTNADGFLSPIDALLVINELNSTSGEGESFTSDSQPAIESRHFAPEQLSLSSAPVSWCYHISLDNNVCGRKERRQ